MVPGANLPSDCSGSCVQVLYPPASIAFARFGEHLSIQDFSAGTAFSDLSAFADDSTCGSPGAPIDGAFSEVGRRRPA
jgi:hypothetical protein